MVGDEWLCAKQDATISKIFQLYLLPHQTSVDQMFGREGKKEGKQCEILEYKSRRVARN